MFCGKCGAQIPDQSHFCTACGQRVEQMEDAGQGATGSQAGATQVMDQVEEQTAKVESSKKKSIPVVVIAVILVVALAGGGFTAYKINQSNSLDVSSEYSVKSSDSASSSSSQDPGMQTAGNEGSSSGSNGSSGGDSSVAEGTATTGGGLADASDSSADRTFACEYFTCTFVPGCKGFTYEDTGSFAPAPAGSAVFRTYTFFDSGGSFLAVVYVYKTNGHPFSAEGDWTPVIAGCWSQDPDVQVIQDSSNMYVFESFQVL